MHNASDAFRRILLRDELEIGPRAGRRGQADDVACLIGDLKGLRSILKAVGLVGKNVKRVGEVFEEASRQYPVFDELREHVLHDGRRSVGGTHSPSPWWPSIHHHRPLEARCQPRPERAVIVTQPRPTAPGDAGRIRATIVSVPAPHLAQLGFPAGSIVLLLVAALRDGSPTFPGSADAGPGSFVGEGSRPAGGVVALDLRQHRSGRAVTL